MEITKFLDTNFPDVTTRNSGSIREAIYKYGIMAYEENESDSDRMIFYGPKIQRMVDSRPLQLECNGLILNTKTWKPVVIPPVLFRNNVNTNVVNLYLAKGLYDMMPVNDGTVITFYYWEPLSQWRIATSRGYDMTECKWGSKTYLEIWNEICNIYKYNSTDEFFETLDKTRSHTFGFKHVDMHPFREKLKTNICKAWFIQSASLINFDDVVYEHAELIPNQVLFQAPDNTRPIYASLASALQQFLDYNKISFGYILRSRNPNKTGCHTHIVFESSLMQNIRKMYYHNDFHRNAAALKYDRDTYITIYSYLDTNRHFIFSRLFPQYSDAFDRLNDITANIIKNIIEYAKNPIASKDNKEQKKIMTIYHTLSRDFTINPNDKHIIKILMSYLLDTRWVNVYYDLYR
jgi:hypothetical protein